MTQAEKVLHHIQQHGSITALDAMNLYGIFRLASRIADLKKQGYAITGKMEAVNNRDGEKCYIKRYGIGGNENG